MYGYIYKTTDLKNGKIYIGQKKSEKFLGLKYVGSGKIVKDILTHLKRNNIPIEERFQVELLDTADTREELNQKEIFFIEKFGSRDLNEGYNLRKGGECGPGGPMFQGHKHTEETRKKMSASRAGSLNSNFGNHWKMTEVQLEAHKKAFSGEKNPMYGKKKENNPNYKKKFMNNGEVQKMVREDEIPYFLSLGYVFGRIK